MIDTSKTQGLYRDSASWTSVSRFYFACQTEWFKSHTFTETLYIFSYFGSLGRA